MPTYEITDTQTGKKFRVTGDSPPTEQEAEQIFASQRQPETIPTEQPGLGDMALAGAKHALGLNPTSLALKQAVAEPAAAIASGAVAEPIAGIAGIAQSINPFADAGAGAKAVEATKEALTYKPRTEAGKKATEAVGGALEPVGKALSSTEDFLGDAVFDATDSPTLAAAAKTIPTAAMELLGVGLGKGALKSGSKLKVPKDAQVQKTLVESAPDIDTLKSTSRGVYKELTDADVKLKPQAFRKTVGDVLTRLKKERINKNRTPKSLGTVEEFIGEFQSMKKAQGRTVADLDDLRSLGQDLASNVDKAEARIGNIIIDEMDASIDALNSGSFTGKQVKDVGPKFKAARNIWGRARRAETLQEAFEKAGRQASGFENGIRTQFRAILNNPKRRRFFKKKELDAMDELVQGTGKQNLFKLIGRLGFSEGQATNILGGLAGAATGNLFGGKLGAIASVGLGQTFRKLAQKATVKNAELADAIVRAGDKGEEVAKAYLTLTTPKNRSVSQLTDILTDPGIDIDSLIDSSNDVVRQSAEIAKGRRAFMEDAAKTTLAASAAQQTKEEE